MKTTELPSTRAPLYGDSLSAKRFQILHCHKKFEPKAVQRLLRTESVALVCHNYLSDAEAEGLTYGFRKVVSRDRADGVPARTCHASHYKLTTHEYLDAVEGTRHEMTAIYDIAQIDLDRKTNTDLSYALAPYGQCVRAAQHGNRSAGLLRGAAWTGGASSAFGLDAHDDAAQASQACIAQRGFEIQNGGAPVAINVYAAAPPNGGALRVWNLRVATECKAALGIAATGYPYRSEDLDPYGYIDIEVRKGTAVLLAGSFAHGVRGWDGDPMARIVFNGFLCLLPDGSVVR